MQLSFRTNRLFLNKLAPTDAEFIFELVNTPEWIKFIGDRNIKTRQDADNFIQQRINDPATHYWVVKLHQENVPLGVVTFIKRNYLEHYDIGFAFLSKYAKRGYAYEAATCVLNTLLKDSGHTCIVATTVNENINSIQLLKKLGLQFKGEIQVENEKLLVYSIATDKSYIDDLTRQFYDLFTNVNGQQPNWRLLYAICLPEVLVIKKTETKEEVYTLETFIDPRRKILSDGTLTEFKEKETEEETRIAGNIAHRFSHYQKRGHLNGMPFEEYGNKFFQFIKTRSGWKINALVWEDEKIGNT